MVSIAKRACAICVIGVIVSITFRRDARGAPPREEKDVRCPENELGPNDRLTLSQWRALFCPQIAESVGKRETGSKCEQSFVTTVGAEGACMVSREDGVVALGAGATANLVYFSRLARHNRILERHRVPRVTSYPSQSRFRFGYWRLGELRRAADIPVGITGKSSGYRCVCAGRGRPSVIA